MFVVAYHLELGVTTIPAPLEPVGYSMGPSTLSALKIPYLHLRPASKLETARAATDRTGAWPVVCYN